MLRGTWPADEVRLVPEVTPEERDEIQKSLRSCDWRDSGGYKIPAGGLFRRRTRTWSNVVQLPMGSSR
jgi:hypothetical protein